ncbi:hypothetical protein TNCV_745821 [Trichonephila clavipes]|nr:hypothetical protein TNCV_745821 [Trichonephila clavipes]
MTENSLTAGGIPAHHGQLSEIKRCRPRAIADRKDRLIVRSAVTELDSSLSTIKRTALTRVIHVSIHKQKIERDLRSYQPLHHLRLTSAHFRARIQWFLA